MKTTLAIIAASFLLVGCGPSASPDKSAEASKAPAPVEVTPEPTPEGDLKEAIQTYSTAYLSGDGVTAHGLLSKRCKDSIALSEFALLTEQAAKLYGDIEISDVTVKVSGGKATATYSYPVKTLNQADEAWVLEGDQWKTDGCP